MSSLQFLFWLCAGCVAYPYVGYPLLLVLVGLFRKRPWPLAPFSGSLSIVITARNEEANLERRLGEFSGLLKTSQLAGEIVVVSDGSTDRTVAIARSCAAEGPVRVLEL